ncbi:MAG TPA: non-homologous end-joining DNA ligase [Candidatus Binatia bacterium]|nr:non-homologous end-joining DNA ligase [Candidatus Binatia bacterium]
MKQPARGARTRRKIAGREIDFSNLDKVMYPAVGFTKGQVIDYYIRIAPTILPHLKDRPITLKRFPDGVEGEHFYEKNAPSFTPRWVKTFPISRTSDESVINYILINDAATLAWSANMANLEIHPFLAKAPAITVPTMIVFDLDPGEGADILNSCEAAFRVKELLDRLNLRSFVKVSGSKGIHLHVPLNTKVTYEATQAFAKSIAQWLESEHGALIVSEMAKAKRKGKVFVDWSQNSEHKSTVAAYSLRAKGERPFVALPVTWGELKRAVDRSDGAALFFEPEECFHRLKKFGDIFAPMLKLKQRLPKPFLHLRGESPEKSSQSAGQNSRLSSFVKGRLGESTALETYRQKRNFSKTPEPPPAILRPSRQGGRKLFVIQKHAASHLHYDLRLEMGGVLKSWAVPKGPPYEVKESRLAMATEDHPMDYYRFEGTIPKGEYGGGTVMVWDTGTYELIDGNYWKGKLHVFLNGKKLKGEWVLIKAAERNGKGNSWYWIKAGAGMKRISDQAEDSSALTGRSMEEIARAKDAIWHSNRKTRVSRAKPDADLASLPEARPRFVEPMLARPVDKLPEDRNQWSYEIKLDGYRCLALRDDKGVKLFSRNKNLLNARFPRVAEAVQKLPAGTLLDGEIVALDESGRPSFNILQNYQSTAEQTYYYAFDLLVYRGKSLLGVALEKRREILETVIAPFSGTLRLSEDFEGEPHEIVAAAQSLGLEGVIGKKKTSVYQPGERSGAWVKYRINQGQELVIGGYIPGGEYFDALLVGYYDSDKLLFVGKIRNGFVAQIRRELFRRFSGLETQQCPFANLPEPKSARRGMALTAEAMKQCRWLKPELVAQIEFTEWTADNHLRHARFAGLRDDKDPREVRREP